MTDSPLLIDDLYQATFAKSEKLAFKSHKRMRQALQEARRFVLDVPMSSFLADIAFAMCNKRTHEITLQAVHHARRAARLPHSVTWIEFDVPAYDQREIELAGERINYDPPETEQHLREGWLLNDFAQERQEYRVHMFRQFIKNGERCVYGVPWPVHWRTNETTVSCLTPTENSVQRFLTDAAIGVAIMSLSKHLCEVSASAHSELIRHHPDIIAAFARGSITVEEFAPWTGMLTGLMRRVWPLLGTINDIPLIFKQPTRLAQGFMARAQYRRFLEHKVITLHVPQQDDRRRKLARAIVAAAKRRAHQVRGHWREDWRRPLAKLCNHEFGPKMICERCGGHKLWIPEHQRGDASLGFVVHDYSVEHE